VAPLKVRARAGNEKVTIWWENSESNDYVLTRSWVRRFRLEGDVWKERGDAVEVVFPLNSVTVELSGQNSRKFKFTVEAESDDGRRSKPSLFSDEVVPFEPLPEPWEERFDKKSNKIFYFNPETNEKSLQRPLDHLYLVFEENRERFQKKEIASMRRRFREIDVDGSGKLDDFELVEMFKDQNLKFSRPKIRRLIKLVDKDRNGTLDFDEFLTLIHMVRTGEADNFHDKLSKLFSGEVLFHGAESIVGKLRMAAGGRAALEERGHEKRLLEKERFGNWTKTYDDARRREFFVNKVTHEKQWKVPDEVRWFLPKALKEVFIEEELEEFRAIFERFDEDQSGEMDVDELTEAMRELGENIAHASVQKLIKQVDVDNSGEVNFAEFVKLMDLRRNKRKNGLFERVVLPANKEEVKFLQKEIEELQSEKTYLRKEVRSLTKECQYLRKRKTVFVPVLPTEAFLSKAGLADYADEMRKFGIKDTTDFFRLEEEDFYNEFRMRRGHMRKLLFALRNLEEHN